MDATQEIEANGEECAICYEILQQSNIITLPCTHTFHAECIAELRKFGVSQACPMCRAKLPPGPEQLNDEATAMYFSIARRVDRGELSWSLIPLAIQGELAEVARLWHLAAEQGHARALHNLAVMYESGEGQPQNYAQALAFYLRAVRNFTLLFIFFNVLLSLSNSFIAHMMLENAEFRPNSATLNPSATSG